MSVLLVRFVESYHIHMKPEISFDQLTRVRLFLCLDKTGTLHFARSP